MIRPTVLCRSLTKTLRFCPATNLKLVRVQRFSSTDSSSIKPKFVSFSSIPKADLGESIFKNEETTRVRTEHDYLKHDMKLSKTLSLISCSFALPVLYVSYNFLINAQGPFELFMILGGDAVIAYFAIKILMGSRLHDFPLDIYYNKETNTFTSVHLNMFARQKALRFKPDDVQAFTQHITSNADEEPKPMARYMMVHEKMIALPDNSGIINNQEALQLLTKNMQYVDMDKSKK